MVTQGKQEIKCSVQYSLLFLCSEYHGNLSSLVDISPKTFKRLPQGKKGYVNVIPLPIIKETDESNRHLQGFFSSSNFIHFLIKLSCR